MVRAFVAVKIECSASLRTAVAKLTRMGRAVKAVSPDALHVTLKFFGEIEEEAIPDVVGVLREAASPMSPCPVRVAGLGAFPRPDRPSVIWAGLENAEPLTALANELDSRLRPLGFPSDRRPFHPHVTLARMKIRPPDELFAMLKEQATTEFGTAVVEAVELLQSELMPDGPKYTTLTRVEFGAE